MPILKTANKKGAYRGNRDKENVINYVLSDSKVKSGLCGGFCIDKANIVGSMEAVSVYFGKTKGVQLRHFILSFHPKETQDKMLVAEIGYRVAQVFSQKYQVVYAVHENKPSLHIHFVTNSVSYVDGSRYYGTRKEFYEIMEFIQYLLAEYGFGKLIYASKGE